MSTMTMMSAIPDKANKPAPAPISVAETHETRFLLYTITYLLCTPSDFANLVDKGEDLETWLMHAGVDGKGRQICIDFVNRILSNKTLSAALKTQRFMLIDSLLPAYSDPPCPNSSDAISLMRMAVQAGKGVPPIPTPVAYTYRHPLPESIKNLMATAEMRTHHALWHYVRTNWPNISPGRQGEFEHAGFCPPRLRGEFGSGLDFIAMHRNMIQLARAYSNDDSLSGWTMVPFDHNDPDWPMPPAYPELPEPAWKTVEFTNQFQAQLQDKFIFDNNGHGDPRVYKGMSLDYLGRFIERGVHDWMHIHWSSDPWYKGAEGQDIDSVENDWLASPYASHVNPHFWKIHGWINDRVEEWATANDAKLEDLLAGAFTGPAMSLAALSKSGSQQQTATSSDMQMNIKMTPQELSDSMGAFLLSRNSALSR